VQPKRYADSTRLPRHVGGLPLSERLEPGEGGPEALPVFFWIHGGGYGAGSGAEPRHDGVALAKKGVVVVTINYRLGVFGFFAHPELTQESPNKASGDQALADMIAALRWVRANIALLGGDPDKVTIAGESAGRTPSAD
jgi:para-nitrobenzyl esterase